MEGKEMKQTLLNAYHLLINASQDYGLEKGIREATAMKQCHAEAMRLRRILNGEVVIDNESMTIEQYCDWKASELIQFEEVAKATVPQSLEQWDEQLEVWLTNADD